jgi:hypothetical protein
MDGVVGRFVTRWKEGEYVVSRAFSRLQETLVSGEFGVTWLLADRTARDQSYSTWLGLEFCGASASVALAQPHNTAT